MNKTIGICLVGCGRVSALHLPAIDAVAYARLVAVCDANIAAAQAGADRWGARSVYTSTAEAFADDAVDAVVMCLPHDAHAPVAIEAARAGKHVLVEKPMANTVADCDAMIGAARRADVRLMVGQSRRFYQTAIESKRRLAEIGDILSMTVTVAAHFERPAAPWWTSAGATGGLATGVMGPHPIDYVTWLFDAAPSRVYCEAARANPLWEGEDEAAIVMRFGDAIATVHLSVNAKPMRFERHIIGRAGTMRLTGETDLYVNDQHVLSVPDANQNFIAQTREFCEAIRERREPSVPGAQGRRVVQILEAARESARSGAPVSL